MTDEKKEVPLTTGAATPEPQGEIPKPKEEKVVSFKKKGADTILQFVDIALRAGGIRYTRAAKYIQDKIGYAFYEPPPPNPAPIPKEKDEPKKEASQESALVSEQQEETGPPPKELKQQFK